MQIHKINIIQNTPTIYNMPKKSVNSAGIAFSGENNNNFNNSILNLFSKKDLVRPEQPKEIFTKSILEKAETIWADAIDNENSAYEKIKEWEQLYKKSVSLQKEALSKIKKSRVVKKSKIPIRNSLSYRSTKTGEMLVVDYVVHSKGISIICISIKKDKGLKDEISYTRYRFPHHYLNDYFSDSLPENDKENIFLRTDDRPISYSKDKQYKDNVEYTCKEEFDFIRSAKYYENLQYSSIDKSKRIISFDEKKELQNIMLNKDGNYIERYIKYRPMSIEVGIESKPNDDGIIKNEKYLFSNGGNLKEYKYSFYSQENNTVYSGARFILRNNKIISRTSF